MTIERSIHIIVGNDRHKKPAKCKIHVIHNNNNEHVTARYQKKDSCI